MVDPENTTIILHLVDNKQQKAKQKPQISEQLTDATMKTQDNLIQISSENRKEGLINFSLEYSLYDEFEDQTNQKEKTIIEINSNETEIRINNQTQYRKVFKFTCRDQEYSCLFFLNKTCHVYLFIDKEDKEDKREKEVNETKKAFNYHIYLKNWEEEMFNINDVDYKSSALLNDLRYLVLFNYKEDLLKETELVKAIVKDLKLCYYYNKVFTFVEERIDFITPKNKIQITMENREEARVILNEVLPSIEDIKNLPEYDKSEINKIYLREKELDNLPYFQNHFTNILPFIRDDYDLYADYLTFMIAKCLKSKKEDLELNYLLFKKKMSLLNNEIVKKSDKTKENLQSLYDHKTIKLVHRTVHLISPKKEPTITKENRLEARNILNEFIDCINNIINHPEYDEIKVEKLKTLLNNKEVENLPYFQNHMTDIQEFTEDDYHLYADYLLYKIAKCLKKFNTEENYFLLYKKVFLLKNEKKKIIKETKENLQILCFKYSLIKDLRYVGEKIQENAFDIDFPLEKSNSPSDKNNNYVTKNYKFALDFIGNIIENLSEKSRLFHCLQQMNQPLSPDISLPDKDNSFELSYIPLKEVKDHVKSIIANFRIVRYHNKSNENGYTNHIANMICINEEKLFGKNHDVHGGNNYSVGLALVMVLCHEFFGHSKLRINHKKANSPTKYYCDGIFNEYIECGNGESGRIFEHHISFNRDVIKKLKYLNDEDKAKKILKVDLWVEKNFHKIRDIVPVDKLENEHDFQKKIQHKSNSFNTDNIPYTTDFCISDEECHYCT